MGNNISSGQYRKLFDLFDQKGTTSERFQQALDKGFLADLLSADLAAIDRHELRIALNLAMRVPDMFPLAVDYGKSLKDMFRAANLAGPDEDMRTFPIEGKGIVEFEARLFHFIHQVKVDEVHAIMRKSNWSPAGIEHLLAFGAAYPDEQYRFPILATRRTGTGQVPELSAHGYETRYCAWVWSIEDEAANAPRYLAIRYGIPTVNFT